MQSADREEDARLVEACISGDSAAWQTFVERFTPMIFAFARRRLRSRGLPCSRLDVDDIAENVFWAFLEKDKKLLKRYNPEYALSTWVGVVSRTQIVRHMRKRFKGPNRSVDVELTRLPDSRPGAPPDPLDRLCRADGKALLGDLIDSLPDRDQKVIRMFYFDGLDYAQIAEELDLSKNSIGSALTRARAKLERRIRGTDVDPTDE